MINVLDKAGLKTLWDRIKSYLSSNYKPLKLETTYDGETINDAWMMNHFSDYFVSEDNYGIKCLNAEIIHITSVGSAVVAFTIAWVDKSTYPMYVGDGQSTYYKPLAQLYDGEFTTVEIIPYSDVNASCWHVYRDV